MEELTKAEEEVMQIIWELGPCTVSQVREYIAEQTGQDKPPHSTVSTFVRLLEKKGYLTHKAYGRTYEYHPAVSKADYSRRTIRKFVSNYFGGSMQRLVSFMVEKNDLSLNELSDMLEQLEKRDKNQSS